MTLWIGHSVERTFFFIAKNCKGPEERSIKTLVCRSCRDPLIIRHGNWDPFVVPGTKARNGRDEFQTVSLSLKRHRNFLLEETVMVVTKLSVFVEAFNSLTLNRPSKSRLYASPSLRECRFNTMMKKRVKRRGN